MRNKMRSRKLHTLLIAALFVAASMPAMASRYNGQLKLGGIMIDEDGKDLSAIQETYNLYDGFSVSRIFLNGQVNPQNFFQLDLNEINLNSRKGRLVYRRPGAFKLTGNYDQHRQVYDPARVVTADRRDWRFVLDASPRKWLKVLANYNFQDREGDRLGFPDSTVSAIGSRYAYGLHMAGVEAEFLHGPRRMAVRYDYSALANSIDDVADRRGNVISVRYFTPSKFIWEDKITHSVRGAYGKHELSNSQLDYELYNLQYFGIVKPAQRFRLRYHLYLNRIDNKAFVNVTDNVQHNFDAFYYYKYGQVYGGYGYQINDDDRSITNYNVYRAGITLRYENMVIGKIEYSSRVKQDEEKLTLLKDLEASRLRTRLEIRPLDNLTLGGRFHIREREFTDIGVESQGTASTSYGTFTWHNWGSVTGDYTFYKDKYRNLQGPFDIFSGILTGRVDFTHVKSLKLGVALSWVDSHGDYDVVTERDQLDIEKAIWAFDGEYVIADRYRLEVRYNRYDFDNIVMVNSQLDNLYHTANVLWFNLAYDFDVER
jgi:hypothetical protein